MNTLNHNFIRLFAPAGLAVIIMLATLTAYAGLGTNDSNATTYFLLQAGLTQFVLVPPVLFVAGPACDNIRQSLHTGNG